MHRAGCRATPGPDARSLGAHAPRHQGLAQGPLLAGRRRQPVRCCLVRDSARFWRLLGPDSGGPWVPRGRRWGHGTMRSQWRRELSPPQPGQCASSVPGHRPHLPCTRSARGHCSCPWEHTLLSALACAPQAPPTCLPALPAALEGLPPISRLPAGWTTASAHVRPGFPGFRGQRLTD